MELHSSYMALWMEGDFGGEWIHIYGWLSLFCYSPKTIPLLTGYTLIQNKKFKIKRNNHKVSIANILYSLPWSETITAVTLFSEGFGFNRGWGWGILLGFSFLTTKAFFPNKILYDPPNRFSKLLCLALAPPGIPSVVCETKGSSNQSEKSLD